MASGGSYGSTTDQESLVEEKEEETNKAGKTYGWCR